MKTILFLITTLLVNLSIFAEEHLSFKGIPIEGNIMEFSKKLEEKGFSILGKESNIILFTGDFTGRTVKVGVSSTGNDENVGIVAVLFEPSREWNNLVRTYDYYKELYTRKYGKPNVSEENNPALSDSNTALMAEVYQGTVVYGSVWELTGGEIEIFIQKSDEVYEGMVVIRYLDSINTNMKIKNDLDDI